MPIISSVRLARISQREFSDLAAEVMHHVFKIHNQFGRRFDEQIYKRELAARLPGVVLESHVDVVHGTFTKQYFADVLVQDRGLFEFKAVEALHPRHRARCIHYLLLFGLSHGKLVNVRGNRVEHEFVNCGRPLEDLRSPDIDDRDWDPNIPGADAFREQLLALIRDWGCGLETELYTQALVHLWGGEAHIGASFAVNGSKGRIGSVSVNLAANDVAFEITSFRNNLDLYQKHAVKLVQHTELSAILWANVTANRLTLTTIL